MRVFGTDQITQGSPEWWEARRGIPTGSGFDRILTPKTLKPSAQQEDYIAELAADVANMNPHWFTDRMTKPPNRAVENGVAREGESRAWLAMERECFPQPVGFCLHDSGLFGCSPDALIVGDAGTLDGALELKNPMLHTHAKYLLAGGLPTEYRCQVHGHLIVTGLARCTFLSYCPGLEPLLIDVMRDDFTDRLEDELDTFCGRYLAALDRLGLRERFEFIRKNVLAHFPEPAP